ncbi:MAG: ABC-ATPase domain-containing protein [bacterium]|nr:ABC-ATPase domain-containing protein [Bacillota bacterium]HHW55585.1 ABC-ATPase domain-containing protein [Bacillota bacterium]
MKGREELERILARIDGKGYKAYKDIQGSYLFDTYILHIDHVQGDPFAAPSRLRVRVDQRHARIPAEFYNTPARRVACADFLTRSFARAIEEVAGGSRGTGKSGLIAIDRCGQEILERTAMVVTDEYVEARIVLGLPARGRTVLGKEARAMLFEELPAIVEASLLYKSIDGKSLRKHVEVKEDQVYLRSKLPEYQLAAFIADGSVLPRESGISDRPLRGEGVVPFVSPPELAVEITLPNAGPVKGMGIPQGVTLIVGGGYHGKSTLLRALERGVYDHIPGDGRELVVTLSTAVKIRAEDGRRVEKVDISPFINNLPNQQDTVDFSTPNASGSTSQAANIMEALEVGAKVLLMDEDTSATNFMIRDVRMQQLVAKEKEPITPFIDRVRQLWLELGVSTVLVLGGSGDYFDVADTIIMMDTYRPRQVTELAKEIAREFGTGRLSEGGGKFGRIKERSPLPRGLDPSRGGKTKIQARGLHTIQYGNWDIDLSGLEQLVDASQTRAIGEIIHYAARKYINGRATLRQVLEQVEGDIENKGLDIISPYYGQNPGDFARPRLLEVAAAINRLRSLSVR